MDLSNKRFLITGGTRGIGRATVEAFLNAGARVAVNGRSASAVNDVLSELDAGEHVLAAPGDLSNLADCRIVVENAAEALGGLDGLVNNAGIGGIYKSLDETTLEDWDAMLNIDLRAVYFCTKLRCRPCVPAEVTLSMSPRSSD
jgi:3-oxoacyl-[acyl-carrier protein] reductase